MNRRGFLAGILACAAAPAIARAASLMPVKALESGVLVPDLELGVYAINFEALQVDAFRRAVLYGDGIHDDTKAVQALLDGKLVMRPNGEPVSSLAEVRGRYLLTDTLYLGRRPWPRP